jgi:hypothetical protein
MDPYTWGTYVFGGAMQFEIILIGAFALLAIGRMAWETLKGREANSTDAEARETWDAIR